MLKIDYLKNHPHFIPLLARWSFDAWGMYNPDATFETVQQKLTNHLNDHCLPLTVIALRGNVPIGMASLRVSDGCDHLGPNFTPWLGSLFVIEQERSKGVAGLLIQEILQKAKDLSFSECYLLTFQKNLVKYYESLGWNYLQDDVYNISPISIMKITT
ncbi:MAG: GNAT family N-acetyltransferase [Alphaproteobacteria bacterium]|nr:GNAT family N-acetyltransferase [Alphaproteobacteria bacterium]